jgi:microcystin-dependent protein
MTEPFLSEIRMFGFNFAPRGWAFCDGQILPINQNQALYSLLGTMYGGDGRTSFALPDLRGRVPAHPGNGLSQGERDGVDAVVLTTAQIPAHTHTAIAATTASSASPSAQLPAPATGDYAWATGPPNATMTATVAAGATQAHSNTQPSSVVSFCIALSGLFPSRN